VPYLDINWSLLLALLLLRLLLLLPLLLLPLPLPGPHPLPGPDVRLPDGLRHAVPAAVAHHCHRCGQRHLVACARRCTPPGLCEPACTHAHAMHRKGLYTLSSSLHQPHRLCYL
jgi:hypothetical protein